MSKPSKVIMVFSILLSIGVGLKSNSVQCFADEVNLSGFKNYEIEFSCVKGKTRESKSQLEGVKLLSTGTSNSESSNSSDGVSGTNVIGDYKTIDLSGDQLKYLANTVQHEIGSFPDKNRENGDPTQTPISNVVSVILNRVLSDASDFKNVNTIYEVVSQPGQFSGIKPFLNLNAYSNYANQDVYDSIKYVLENGDTTNGALFFHSGAPSGFFVGGTIKFQFKDYAGHYFYSLK